MCESLVQLKQIRAATETSKGSTYRKPGKVLRNQFPLHLDLSLHLHNLLLKVIEEYTNNAHKIFHIFQTGRKTIRILLLTRFHTYRSIDLFIMINRFWLLSRMGFRAIVGCKKKIQQYIRFGEVDSIKTFRISMF